MKTINSTQINAKRNKYTYLIVIQQTYGFGWEDNSEYECTSSYVPKDKETYKADLKEYRLTGYNTRSINRKELNR